MADSENRSDVGSNPSDGSCDIWCQKSLRRLRTDCTALFLLGISEWTHSSRSRRAKIVGQGGPRSGAKADHDWGPRRTKHEGCEGQGGPRSGVYDWGSRRAAVEGQGNRSGFIRGCAAPGSEPLPYFRESRTPKTYPILGKSHNPGHPKRSGLQKHTPF